MGICRMCIVLLGEMAARIVITYGIAQGIW